MKREDLKIILEKHANWLADKPGGERANLQCAYLQGAYLQGAYLQGANLQDADLQDADLQDADLQDADLQCAYLQGAYLQGANLRGATYGAGIPLTRAPLQILGLRWPVLVLDQHIKIGCQLHTTQRWAFFTDKQISGMSEEALAFWTKYKTTILSLAAAHQEPQA